VQTVRRVSEGLTEVNAARNIGCKNRSPAFPNQELHHVEPSRTRS